MPETTPTRRPADTAGRRDFLKVAGLALGAGAGVLGLPRRARAADRVEISFAAAKWYGKETIRDLAEAYNQSQSKVHVTHIELPPPSSSTEVHQALVQQLAEKR